jgi:CDP-glucose 4,6-dehydratase
MQSTIGDIRDYALVSELMKRCEPEIVIHMAAQPLVRFSYEAPIETFATNVMGTVHILEAIRQLDSVRVVINVTTDKCYENKDWIWGYREDDAIGGFDPYSSSKGCSELVTNAYRRSFFQESGVALASARSGNVIGGGDWAADRLVPDVLRALERSEPVVIRNPRATRPWQHVLEPLSGYLMLAERLYVEGQAFADAWNFGPLEDDARPVQWIVEKLIKSWGSGVGWEVDQGDHLHEANHLKLDISKARSLLGWHPRWRLQEALLKITDWHRQWLRNGDVRLKCLEQINDFQNQEMDE